MKVLLFCSILVASLAVDAVEFQGLITLNEVIPNDISDAYMANITKNSIRARVFYGQRAAPNQFPFAVWLNLLFGTGITHCGGSLISRNFVLSSARCVTDTSLKGIDVHLGSIDINAFPFKTSADAFVSHEAFSAQTAMNDISLIRMRLSVMNPVARLPRREMASMLLGYEKNSLSVAGWGYSENGPISQYLLYINQVDTALTSCGFSNQSYSNLICAKGNGRNTAAFGDFGGPVLFNDQLFAIYSFTVDKDYFYDLCTRIDPHLYWISYYTGIQIQ